MKKYKLELTQQEFDDLHSCIGIAEEHYPKEGAVNFHKALKRLNKKFWKIIWK